jgi:uncharacterized MAPEG superfamily protein
MYQSWKNTFPKNWDLFCFGGVFCFLDPPFVRVAFLPLFAEDTYTQHTTQNEWYHITRKKQTNTQITDLTCPIPPAQRAHANFTENQTSAVAAVLIAGLHFPVISAILGATWSFGRVLYLYGYTGSAGPKGRSLWVVHWFPFSKLFTKGGDSCL